MDNYIPGRVCCCVRGMKVWVGREEWGEGEIQGEQNRRMQEETRKKQTPGAGLCREGLVVKQRTWGPIRDDQIPS